MEDKIKLLKYCSKGDEGLLPSKRPAATNTVSCKGLCEETYLPADTRPDAVAPRFPSIFLCRKHRHIKETHHQEHEVMYRCILESAIQHPLGAEDVCLQTQEKVRHSIYSS